MKKVVAVLFAALVLAGCSSNSPKASGGNQGNNSNNNNTQATSDQAANSSGGFNSVAACDVFTSAIATQILGSSAMKGTPGIDESSSDIAWSDCVYTAGPNVDPPHVTSVAIRSAKDSTGAATNKQVFTSMPPGTQKVSGFGDAAYWDQSLGQLNVLKGNNWYIISNYTGTAPSNGTATLAMAEQLAQAITLK